MQLHAHQDTSTQAMTEVALGLSMAFFSLLILALFSIGLPEKVQQTNPINTPQLNAKEQLTLAKNENGKSSSSVKNTAKQNFIFYLNRKFYDQQLTPISQKDFNQFNSQQNLILAVKNTLPLAEIMAIRSQINHSNLSITMLNKEWLTRLEQAE